MVQFIVIETLSLSSHEFNYLKIIFKSFIIYVWYVNEFMTFIFIHLLWNIDIIYQSNNDKSQEIIYQFINNN